MLGTIGMVLVAMWLLGFISHAGGWWIHLLLVMAVIVFVVNFLSGRRTA